MRVVAAAVVVAVTAGCGNAGADASGAFPAPDGITQVAVDQHETTADTVELWMLASDSSPDVQALTLCQLLDAGLPRPDWRLAVRPDGTTDGFFGSTCAYRQGGMMDPDRPRIDVAVVPAGNIRQIPPYAHLPPDDVADDEMVVLVQHHDGGQ